MAEANSKNKVLAGLFWKFGERILAQGVSFVVSVVLARLLAPSDYGIIAMVLIFITIADVFVSSGFATALIQKKDSDATDFSTMFYCSLAVSIFIYLIVYAMAPFIASFYGEPILKNVLRVFALRIPLSVYNTIQHAYVSRHMLFKRFFFSTLFGTLFSGVVGIVMAYMGAGVWALVAQYFTNTIIDTVVLAITVPWHPQLLFSWEAAKKLMNYGSKILFADLSGTFFGQLRSFIIGKVYTSADLAYYNKGQQLPTLITNNISASIMTVLFPAISNEGDNTERVKQMSKRAIQLLSYVMFPLLCGLAVVAKPLILFLYTDKWSDCIPFVQLLCISSAIGMLTTTSLQTIKAIGRSDVVLKLEILKKPVYILLLVIGVYRGIVAIAVTMVVYELYGAVVNMVQLSKYVSYGVKEQCLDMLPALLMTLLMASVVVFTPVSIENSFWQLMIKVTVGVVVYIIESVAIKPQAYTYLIGLIREKMNGAHK